MADAVSGLPEPERLLNTLIRNQALDSEGALP